MKNLVRDSSESGMPCRGIASAAVAWGWIITTGLLLLLAALPAFSAESATFRGDPQHSGVYAAAGVPKLNGIKWTFHAAGRVDSSPAVADSTVYIGSTAGLLYAVDRAAGKEKWHFEAKARIASSPAGGGGLVYFPAFEG